MRFILITTVILISIACGKSEAEKQAEDMARAAEELAKAAETAAKDGSAASDDVAKAMQGMAAAFSGTGADGQKVEPIAFQTLQTHLPKVAGWEMSEPRGERMTMPVAYSQTKAEYSKGDATVEVTLADTANAQLLMAPWAVMLAAGYSHETSDGYEKAVTIGGNPAVEKWDTPDKRGEYNIVVAKRFMVTIQGYELTSIKDLQAFTSAMNFGAIAALK